MQRQVYSRIEVAREAYPYLLAYLQQRAGTIQRVSNSFVNQTGRKVAVLLNPDSLMVLGEGIFQSERVSISKVVTTLRAKGRLRVVRTNLFFCGKCQAFLTSRFSSNEHEIEGESHPLKQLLSLSYPVFVNERKSLFASKAWIGPEVLARIFTVRRGPLTAKTLASFRCDAYTAGVRITIQELLDYTEHAGPVVEEVELVRAFLKGEAYERYVARSKPSDNTVKVGRRRRVHLTNTIPVVSEGRRSITSWPKYGWKAGTMLEWKVKVNGIVLTREQKLVAMVQLGLLDENSFRQSTEAVSEDSRSPDELPISPDEEERLHLRYRASRRSWKPKRVKEKEERTTRDRSSASVRYASVPPNPQQLVAEIKMPTATAPSTAPRLAQPWNHEQKRPAPAPKTSEQIQEERVRFLQRFSISPEEIVYEKGGIVKAEKMVASDYDVCRLQIFNTIFYPQRAPLPGEFSRQDVALAERVSAELDGAVVVADDPKRGFSSLAVSIAGLYTVRVATRGLQD